MPYRCNKLSTRIFINLFSYVSEHLQRLKKRLVAFERRLLTQMTNIKETVVVIDLRIALVSVSEGIGMTLPVSLPRKTVDDAEQLEMWLKKNHNKTDFVSIYCIMYKCSNYMIEREKCI